MNDVDPILDMYLFEATQMIEQTEAIILDYDHTSFLTEHAINEIFRCMHTLKGSSAMMQFEGIAEIAHTLEDIIHFIRERAQIQYNPVSLSNLILESIDYFKEDLNSITNFGESKKNEHYDAIKGKLKQYLDEIKQATDSKKELTVLNEANTQAISKQDAVVSIQTISDVVNLYILKILFTDDCQMENIRAYQLVHHLAAFMLEYDTDPVDLIGDENATDYIKKHGFTLKFQSVASYEQLLEQIEATSYIKSIDFQTDDVIVPSEQQEEVASIEETFSSEKPKAQAEKKVQQQSSSVSAKNSVVSVNVQKLDKLMDLVGELVIAEAIVANTIRTLTGDTHSNIMEINQLSKITSDLQDTIMSIRMVPLSPVFNKMRRITRDMCQKLNKQATIEIIGEETEIDKSVIDRISDPLMHIVRNCIDHGIEDSETRLASNKPEAGKVVLEARNIGSDVLLIISDDGRGINKERILEKAYEAGLVPQLNVELTDREIYQFLFHPGLSTKEEITEFSGRGVGMDVVASNIEQIGGTIYIDSQPNKGSTFTIKIPLTLAIIDGMNIRVGQSHFTVPTTSIKESFRPAKQHIIQDISGQNMVMVRGEVYSIVKLSEYFSIASDYSEPEEAILLMVEHEQKAICVQVDELLGQQQVVIKPLPEYLTHFTRTNRLSGCTLLGNGNISMILNTNELVHNPY